MDDVKICELPKKNSLNISDYILVETEDGTQRARVSNIRSLIDLATTFDTMYDMRNAPVEEGTICITLGYRTKNDGGAAQYIIVDDPTLKPNGADIIKMNTSDTLRAVFINVSGGTVSPEQFGAYGNGKKDDSNAIQRCIDSGYQVLFKNNSKYLIYTSIEIPINAHIDFNGATLIPFACDGIILSEDYINEYNTGDIRLSNFIIDAENAFDSIDLSSNWLDKVSIEFFTILNTAQNAFRLGPVNHCTICHGNASGHTDYDTNLVYTDMEAMSDFIDSGAVQMDPLDRKYMQMTISDIYTHNIGIIVDTEKDSKRGIYENIIIRDITYTLDVVTSYSMIFKSAVNTGYVDVVMSNIHISDIARYFSTRTSGTILLDNIVGTPTNEIGNAINSTVYQTNKSKLEL